MKSGGRNRSCWAARLSVGAVVGIGAIACLRTKADLLTGDPNPEPTTPIPTGTNPRPFPDASGVSDSGGDGSGSLVIWKPALQTSWHWMIDHAVDLTNAKDMGLVDPSGTPLKTPWPKVYDIDWELNPAATVAALRAAGNNAICYVDVGAYETDRPDAAQFPKSVIGAVDPRWSGSFWLDIRQLAVLGPIMKARFQVCKDKGFDAVEPDEIDGYANATSFPLTYDDQIAYNKYIANLAHSMGLGVGQKGDVDQAKDLWPFFDWTLNEQCFQFNECNLLTTSYAANGKAVFSVEYDDPVSGYVADPSVFCPQANALNFNAMKMPPNLNGGRIPCR